VDAPDNLIMAKQAIDEYQKVLQNDPGNINSLKGIAYIFMNTKQFDDSLAYYKKVVAADPNDAEAYYSVGVVDWTVVFKETTTLKARAGLRVEDDVKAPRNQKLCDDLRTSNQEHIEEGLTMLRKRWPFGRTILTPWSMSICCTAAKRTSTAMTPRPAPRT